MQVLQKISEHIPPPVSSRHYRFERNESLDAPEFCYQQSVVAQLRECGVASEFFCCSFRERFGEQVIEMLRKLFYDLGLARRLEPQLSQSASDLFFPSRHADL